MGMLTAVETVCAVLLMIIHMIGGREYCQWDKFQASCAKDEVILMKSAEYGRMEYGRCIERDYGYVGCSSKVLPLSDKRCSGRRECEIEIPDKDFDKITPCPKDLVRYLNADFECKKVESPTRRDCYGSKYMRLKKTSGFIASVTTEDTTCGSTETPWLIEAKPGQTINFTLHDFAQQGTNVSTSVVGPHCHVYAIFKESHARRSSSVCGGRHRVSHAYSSTSNEVQVRILGARSSSPRYFMLEWNISGCPDFDPISGGWVERNGNEALVGCNDASSGETWKLICRGSEWEGQVGSCSAAASQVDAFGGLRFPQTLSIIIIIAVALAIGALILLIGLVCLKRRRNSPEPESKYSEPVVITTSREETYKTTTSGYSTGYSQPSLLSNNDTSGSGENEYEYVEDLIKPALPPPPPPGPGRGYPGTMSQNIGVSNSPANCVLHGNSYNQYGFSNNPGFATIRGANGNHVSSTGNHGNTYMADNVSVAPQYYELDPEGMTSNRGCDTGVPKERLVAADVRQVPNSANIDFGRYSQ